MTMVPKLSIWKNAILCTGSVETASLESIPCYYVRKLSESIHNTYRNNWFTSVPFIDNTRKNVSLARW